MLISLFPAQVIAFAQDAVSGISVSDENDAVSNAASDTFYAEWRYKVSIRTKTEKFYDAESFFSTMATADKGTFLLYCNHELTADAVVPQGVIFILPLTEKDTLGKGNGTTDFTVRESWKEEETYLYSTMTIPEGITFTVNGTLLVGGIVGSTDRSSQGHTSGNYSQIVNNGSIQVNGTLDVYGLVKGAGTAEVNDGGIMKLPFLINDFDGGTNSVTLRDAGVFPFNQFAMNNVQCNCLFNYGCRVIGKGLIYFSSVSMYLDAEAPLIGAEEGALLMSEGSTVTSSYDDTQVVSTTIGGTVLDDFGKTTLTTHGSVAAGNIKLTYQVYNFDSAEFFLGIPYNFDLIVADGTLSVPYKYRFMPGSHCTVCEGATLNLTGELQVVDGWEQPVMSEKRYPTSAQLHENGFSQSGNLIVNGTLVIRSGATFAGIVQCTDDTNAKIIVADDAILSGTFKAGAKSEKENGSNSSVSYYLSARVYGENGLEDISAGNIYTADSTESWTLESYTMNVIGTETTVEINETLTGSFAVSGATPEMEAIEESGSVLDDAEKYVYGISTSNTAVNDFLTSSDESAQISLNKNGQYVATGDTVDLVMDGNVIDSYTIVIIGDADKDSLCTGMDSIFVQSVVSGLLNSGNTSESVLRAADCNRDGNINQDDVLYAQSSGLYVGSYFNANGEIVNGSIITPTEEPSETEM